MTIPTLAIPTSAEIAVPYVTAAQFKGYPTWLDLDNLVPGGIASVQNDELADCLLAASDWAVRECEDMRLDAHWVQNENITTRPGGGGRIYVQPRDVPVRAVTALSWGYDPSMLIPDTLPDDTMWIEDGRLVSFLPGGQLSFTGTVLQFGAAASPNYRAFVTWSYVAGFPNTTMPNGATAAAMSVTVADPTGILPGDVLRIYDVGQSEAVTVATTYAPAVPTIPPTPTSIPLAAAVANNHADGTGITGFPRKIVQAVIAYTVALLMREDVAAEAPVSNFGPAARTTEGGRGGQAAGLVNDARSWLRPYAPVLRS